MATDEATPVSLPPLGAEDGGPTDGEIERVRGSSIPRPDSSVDSLQVTKRAQDPVAKPDSAVLSNPPGPLPDLVVRSHLQSSAQPQVSTEQNNRQGSPSLQTRAPGNARNDATDHTVQSDQQHMAQDQRHHGSLEGESPNYPAHVAHGETHTTKPLSLSYSWERLRKTFACPYFKNQPSKYLQLRECALHGSSTVGALRDHLERYHKQPLHCPRCFTTFSTHSDLYNHMRNIEICALREPIRFEGYNEDQEKNLQLFSEKRTESISEEMWQRMYATLFRIRDPSQIPSPYRITPSELDLLTGFQNFITEFPSSIKRELDTSLDAFMDTVQNSLSKDVESAIRAQFPQILKDMSFRLLQAYQFLNASPQPKPDASRNSLHESQGSHRPSTQIEEKSESGPAHNSRTPPFHFPPPNVNEIEMSEPDERTPEQWLGALDILYLSAPGSSSGSAMHMRPPPTPPTMGTISRLDQDQTGDSASTNSAGNVGEFSYPPSSVEKHTEQVPEDSGQFFDVREMPRMRSKSPSKPRRRYQCKECGRTFHYPKDLQKHLTVHTGVRPFRCETCGITMTRRDNLIRHRRKNHPEEHRTQQSEIVPMARTQQSDLVPMANMNFHGLRAQPDPGHPQTVQSQSSLTLPSSN